MSHIPSVFVAIPTMRVEPEHYTAIDAMSRHSKSIGQTIRLEQYTLRTSDHAPTDLLARLQEARSDFLNSGSSILMIVEDDIVVPPHAAVALGLESMRHTPPDVPRVTYGLMVCRQVPFQWSASLALYPNGENYSMRPHRLAQREAVRLLAVQARVPVQGCGMFCVAIPRIVVERIPFRQVGDHWPDLSFSLDCLKEEIDQWMIPSVVCGHIDGNRILYPNTTDSDGNHWHQEERSGK